MAGRFLFRFHFHYNIGNNSERNEANFFRPLIRQEFSTIVHLGISSKCQRELKLRRYKCRCTY